MTDASLFASQLASLVHAQHLMTPIEGATTFTPDDREADAVHRLRRHGFDFAPVVTASQIIGRVARSELTPDRSHPIAPRVEPLSPKFLIGASASISDLVRRLESDPWLFVVGRGGIDGIVTPADLNRHAARTYFFLLIAAFEVTLAGQVRAHLPDQAALDALSPKAKEEVVDRHTTMKKGNLDIDVVAAMTLANLQTIVARTPAIRSRWATTATAWNRLTSSLVDFRNRIAHPSRPILGDGWSLGTLKDRLETLAEFVSSEAQ